MAKTPKIPLLDCQKAFIEDDKQFVWWAASRQTGKSHAIAVKAVKRGLVQKRLRVILSRGERQSVEVGEKIRMICQAMGAASELLQGYFADTSLLQHTIKFPNESRIILLPANPDTARGYSADTTLDEFGLHKDSVAIWRALYPSVTRGYNLDVASTFFGTENKFYAIGRELGLADGIRPERQPVTSGVWSGHWTDIYMAAEQAQKALGLKISVEALRAGLADEEAFLQEYCNVPLSSAENYFPADLVMACVTDEASVAWDGAERPGLSAAMDIGRKRDRTVIVLGDELGDVAVMRGMITLERMPFAMQLVEARAVARVVQECGGRFAIDATGIGAQMAETLAAEYPCVEQVVFTAALKEQWAVTMKRRLEDRTVRLPDAPALRRAFAGIKRTMGPTGVMRFDAARTEQGHSDEAWAAMLWVAAMQTAASYVPASECGLVGSTVMGALMGREF
jgi:phage FluMu gp28-like protein